MATREADGAAARSTRIGCHMPQPNRASSGDCIAALGLIASILLTPRVAGAQSAEETAARAAVDRFFEAWNKADNLALRETIHLPHVFLVGAGSARVAETWDDIAVDFDELRRREGWAKSTLDETEATYVSEKRVHLELVFSRLDAAGEAYSTVGVLWIMTRRDGRWGVQVRSILGGPAGAIDSVGKEAAEQASKAFFTAWNTADNTVLRTAMSFPFATLFGDRVVVAQLPADFSTDFEAMKESQGWHHSTLESFRVLRATPTKAHCEMEYSRHRADGTTISSGRMFYIFTRQDDRWGLQFRAPIPR